MKIIENKMLREAPEDKKVSFKLPKNVMFNPNERDLDIKGFAKRAKQDADAKAEAERIAKETAEKRAKFEAENGDILAKVKESDASTDDKLEMLFEVLVPSKGEASTVAGELVRAMMRILYRDYNDGDLFYEGYGIETCGSSVAYLIYMIEELYSDFNKIAGNQLEDDRYTKALEAIAEKVIQFIVNGDSAFTENHEDSRGSSWEKVYEEDYQDEWEPKYEAELDIPDAVQEHMDRGNISIWDVHHEVESWLEYEYEFKGAELERPWGSSDSSITISNLTREGRDKIENWNSWRRQDEIWEDYIDQLNSEYGNPEDEEEEEDWDEDEDEEIEESYQDDPDTYDEIFREIDNIEHLVEYVNGLSDEDFNKKDMEQTATMLSDAVSSIKSYIKELKK